MCSSTRQYSCLLGGKRWWSEWLKGHARFHHKRPKYMARDLCREATTQETKKASRILQNSQDLYKSLTSLRVKFKLHPGPRKPTDPPQYTAVYIFIHIHSVIVHACMYNTLSSRIEYIFFFLFRVNHLYTNIIYYRHVSDMYTQY